MQRDNEISQLAKSVTNDLDNVKNKLKEALLSAGQLTGIIIVCTCIVVLVMELIKMKKIDSINQWPKQQVTGTIIGSHMETYTRPSSYSLIVFSSTYYTMFYRTRIAFEYTYKGHKYTSYRCTFNESWTTNPAEAKSYIEKYKVGDKVNVIINPDNPEEAYLFNKSYDSYSYLVLPIIIIFGWVVIKST